LTASQVGDDVVERTKVLRRESMQDFVDQNGDVVPDSFQHAWPIEAEKCIDDVVQEDHITDVLVCFY